MALYDYVGALRKGRRQYQASVSRGEYPYLPVLDDILSYSDIVSEVNLGIMDIPLEKIIGTKTEGRTNAFASNFMPLLSENPNLERSGLTCMIIRFRKEFMIRLLFMNS
ncbi:hypothetical protein [Lacrimispora xylanisolvens]|uniref:hypothetical protein n=1 Tax=Lacrimispora xylanisolvens TaxID=384636 RepID=UPI00240291CA